MSKEDLAKIEKEIEKKLQPDTVKDTRKQFRVDVNEVKKIAERLQRLSQKPDATLIR